MTVTDEQSRFHNQTAKLITTFLRSCKLSATTVNKTCFTAILKHLNPLVQVPKMEEVEIIQKTFAYDPLLACNQPPCIICGAEIPSHRSLRVANDDAALFLTAAVITDRKTIQQAKRDILNERLTVCIVHSVPSYKSMFEALGLNETSKKIDDLPDYHFLSGLSVFNKLWKMRNLYEDKSLEDMKEEEYRIRLKRWMIQNKPKPPKKARKRIPDVKKAEENIAPAPPLTSIETAAELLLREAIKRETDDPVDKRIKLEDSYSNSEQSALRPCPSSAPATPSAPNRIVVYTLKNGKKVVKAPPISPAVLARSAGRLITYRVATRKPAEYRKMTSVDLAQKVNKIPRVEEKLPDTMKLEKPTKPPTSCNSTPTNLVASQSN